MENELTKLSPVSMSPYLDVAAFEHIQRVAKMICSSALVPVAYQNNVQNTIIALEMANRLGISPMAVMQNLYIVKGNPGWSGSFVIAIINGSRRFDNNLKFEFSGEGDSYGCVASTTLKGERVESTKVDWKMVKGEGWFDKPGSKWKTMPDQMFRYRSAAFFGRAETPDLLMGMQTAEEIVDIDLPISRRQVITVDELQLLLDEKVPMLTKSEFDHAKRIISGNEVDSFEKLHTFLTDKTE